MYTMTSVHMGETMFHGPFFFLWIIVSVVCVVLVLKMLKDRRTAEDEPQVTDEARMVQEMYRSLSRMEQRIQVLEDLLAERGPQGVNDRGARRGEDA